MSNSSRPIRRFLVVFLVICVEVSSQAATRTVTNLDDSGPGSLRDTIAASINGDVIDIGVLGTITLTSGELTVGRNITIRGTGAIVLALSGNNSSRIFNFLPGSECTISGLTIRDGRNAGTNGLDLSAYCQ